VGTDRLRVHAGAKQGESHLATREIRRTFADEKRDFLHRHIQEYRQLFRRISELASGDSYLVLDDAYHIRRVDQPLVIDYFHRVSKGNRLWLKIGTIRHRASWYVNGDPPTGMKIGDDADEISLDLSLEKFRNTRDFLLQIIDGFFKACGLSRRDLVTDGAVDRLVLASGGVARDFLGIFRRAIDQARERHDDKRPKLNAEDVNNAAGEYDKSKQQEFRLDTSEDISELEVEFGRIRDFCTRRTKKNVFLVDKDSPGTFRDRLEELVDLRLIHRVNSRVTVSGRKSKLYEAFMLDISQYTAARKIRDFEIIEFWRQDPRDRIRLLSIIYEPEGASV
jgi:hypothetical protein